MNVAPHLISSAPLNVATPGELPEVDQFGEMSVAVWVDTIGIAEGTPQFATHLGELIAGRPLPGITYWRAGCDGDRTRYTARFEPNPTAHDEATITVSLTIENCYELYPNVTSYVADAVIPAPPADGDDAVRDWEQQHLIGLTGVGNVRGDSYYEVTITACSDPHLVGRTVQTG